MGQAEVFVALLVPVVLVALVARRLERVPDAVALVLAGLAVGALPFTPDVRLSPDLILVVFLPPILFPSAFNFAFEDVRSNLRPITLLAFGLVVATMAAIAVAVHLVGNVPWAAAFALGAVLAPTDPVAATGVIRSSGGPGRLATIVEGESLINDGTALTALKIATVAVGGSFAIASTVGQFVVVAFGGAALGAALGWGTAWLRRRIDDLEIESAIGVLLSYSAYVLADAIGMSGVLAVVLAGYVLGRSGEIASPDTRLGGASFWTVVRFLGESILFLLVGIAFAGLLAHPVAGGGARIVELTAIVVAVAVAVRLGWMFGLPPLMGVLRRGDLESLMSPRERAVIGASGLRGAVSVAAALSLPATVGGIPFPQRDTLVAVAIASIVVLLVLPAAALRPLLRALGFETDSYSDRAARSIRAELADAALAATDGAVADPDIPDAIVRRIRAPYELRVRTRDADPGADGYGEGDRRVAIYRSLSRLALDAERARLGELRRAGAVHGELLRQLERDLDLDEIRLG